MLNTILKLTFVAGWLAAYVVRGLQVRKVASERGGMRQRMADYRRMEWVPLTVDTVARHVLPLVYLLTPWLNWANYGLPTAASAALGVLGAVVFAFALWLLWRSHADLGRNWTPMLEIRPGHQLVTAGVFRYIRHPMYAAHWLWSVAQALLLQNWVAGFLGVVAFVPLLLVRIPSEERMMLAQFGDEYRAYQARTGALVPRRREAGD